MPLYDTQKWFRTFLDVGIPDSQARCLVDLCHDASVWSRRGSAMTFDVLKHFQRLRDADFTETQARAVVHVCFEALTGIPTPEDDLDKAA